MSFDQYNDEAWHLISGPVDETTTQVQIYGSGWIRDDDEVAKIKEAWELRGVSSRFQDAAPNLMMDAADDRPVFFFDAEEYVLGSRLNTWNQNPVGSCVGFGNTRGAQDLQLWEIAAGEVEEWPGAELCPEVTYGGSRYEIGGNRIRGDGSVGAWAVKFMQQYGVVKRGVYGSLDLTRYNPTTCRNLGSRGIPSDLETIAKEHPVQAFAQVKTAEEVWAAIGGGKPVVPCSNAGFGFKLGSDGFCDWVTKWNHCMTFRGRFLHPRKKKSIVVGNSWDDYLSGGSREVEYVKEDGTVGIFILPPGHFCITLATAGQMASQNDTWALAGFRGWDRLLVDYGI